MSAIFLLSTREYTDTIFFDNFSKNLNVKYTYSYTWNIIIEESYRMKITWKGNWKKGEVSVETEGPEELIETLKKLESVEGINSILASADTKQIPSVEKPTVSGNVGPSEAIRDVLNSAWGRAEPRTMNEIMEVLKESALFFSTSTVSGVLTNMTKSGVLRRPAKKDNKWAYVLAS